MTFVLTHCWNFIAANDFAKLIVWYCMLQERGAQLSHDTADYLEMSVVYKKPKQLPVCRFTMLHIFFMYLVY